MNPTRAIIALVLAGLAGCSPNPDPAQFYTLGQLRAAAQSGADVSGLPASEFVVLRDQAISWDSPPYGPLTEDQRPDLDGTLISPAFCQGEPAAYVTTEVWYDYAPIWWQPLYVLVTEYDASNLWGNVLPGSLPIFSVGPNSSFYSPYWQVYFVVVPPDTDPTSITSNEQVLDGNYPLVDGPGKICPLVPDDVYLSQVVDGGFTRPLDGLPIGPVKQIQGYLDGQLVDAFDFGANRMEVTSTGQVIETPLFKFVSQSFNASSSQSPGEDGLIGTSSLGLPTVAGVGPLYSGQVDPSPNNVPQFGALWRVYEVTLPATAGVFVLDTEPALAQMLTSEGLQVPAIDPAIAALPDAPDYLLRVALNPACFGDPTQFPQGCQFLDSQAAIEGLISPNAINVTPFDLNCELVELNGLPVPNP